jgi:YYY domain-containing protein
VPIRSSLVTRHSSLFFALLGALLVAVIGNLGQLVVILDSFLRIGGGSINDDLPRLVVSIFAGIAQVIFEGKPFDVPTGNWYWTATRVIPDTINEFPFFTFLYADLHAHLMALPFTLVVIGLCVTFVTADGRPPTAVVGRWSVVISDLLQVAVAALVFGALRAINFADFFPTYFGLILCALAIGEYARRGAFDWSAIGAVAWRFIAIVVLATLFYQPFVSNFATAYLNIEMWQGARTKLVEYLTVHGIFLFAAATFLGLATFDTPARRGLARFLRLAFAKRARFARLTYLHRALVAYPTLTEDLALIGFAVLVVVEFLLVVAGFTVFAFVLPLGVLAAVLVLRPGLDPARRFIALMIGAALALTLMVEVITYKGDIGRMNTVFKYYLQVWVFLGVAGAAGLAVVSGRCSVNSGQRTVRALRFALYASLPKLWWLLFAVLLCAGFLYPIFATRAKVNDRFVPNDSASLNGMDYMRGAVYYDQNKELILEFDREAIEWLRENVQGSPVILEGNAGLYHWGNRVSIYTGLPTVIGWDWHQKQQRSIIDGAIIDARIANVRQIYSARDWNVALELMKRYQVAYVYIGDMERAFYSAEGLAKFDAMAQGGWLELMYQNDRVKIFRVKDG